MELEYTDKNAKRSKLYIAAGILIALIVGAAVFFALQASNLVGSAGPAQMRSVVVAVREIPGRKPIEEGDVAVRQVAVDAVEPAGLSRDELLELLR